MNMALSLFALALVGLDDPTSHSSQPPSGSLVIGIKVDVASPRAEACPKASNPGLACSACPDSDNSKASTATLACPRTSPCNASSCETGVIVAKALLEQAVALTCSPSVCPAANVPPASKPFDSNPKPLVKEVKQVEQAQSISTGLPTQLPKVAKPKTAKAPEAQENWPMTLRQAIRIALDNSEIVREIAIGAQGIPIGGFEPTPLNSGAQGAAPQSNAAPIVIARLNADASPWRFKAEVMAHLRSVEQVYWNLAQAHLQLGATDRTVTMARELLHREQSELVAGRGTVADVAEAAQRLEQFNLDLVTRTSDVITTERQLRNILGLPPADNRRIIPITPATEAKFEPDWDHCLHQMLEQQPDIVQKKLALGDSRDDKDCPIVNKDQLEGRKVGKQAELQQAIHQQTHSMARFFLEIDANYKQMETAKRLRNAAAQRLDCQRAYYKEGRITIDRYMDAIGQYCTAVATEGQYKANYNISIAALGEAKGTLLSDYGIAVSEGPHQVKAYVQADQHPQKDEAAKTTAFLKPVGSGTSSANQSKAAPAPTPASESKCQAACCEQKKDSPHTEAATSSKTWTFSITIGSGPNPVQIKGTISADSHAQPTP